MPGYLALNCTGTILKRGSLTFLPSHGYDVALEVTLEDAPCALIDYERSLVRHPRVHVGFGDDPCRSVGNALREWRIRSETRHARQSTYQVENLALSYQVVQAIHDLLDAARPVPLQGVNS